MPADLQEILKVSVRDFARQITSKLKMFDLAAVAEARASGDITIHDWSAEERAKFRKIAQEQWKIFAKKSPNAQKVYDVISKYLKETGLI